MFDVNSAMIWKMQLMTLGSFFKPKQIFTKYLCVCLGRGGAHFQINMLISDPCYLKF